MTPFRAIFCITDGRHDVRLGGTILLQATQLVDVDEEALALPREPGANRILVLDEQGFVVRRIDF